MIESLHRVLREAISKTQILTTEILLITSQDTALRRGFTIASIHLTMAIMAIVLLELWNFRHILLLVDDRGGAVSKGWRLQLTPSLFSVLTVTL